MLMKAPSTQQIIHYYSPVIMNTKENLSEIILIRFGFFFHFEMETERFLFKEIIIPLQKSQELQIKLTGRHMGLVSGVP